MDADFLHQLSDSQRLAVEYIDGPSLVIAGAGSGKTRVLTYKIAYLLHQGMKPWNILALTFTNKAAEEMKERVGKLVGEENARYLRMGTFHSIFSRILRAESQSVGFNSNFTIYDESDSRSLLKSIIKSMALDDKIYKPSTIHNRISMAKNHLILDQQYMADPDVMQRDLEARIPQTGAIFSAYQARLKSANAMDFDDLLVYTYVLFDKNPEIKKKYSEYFQFVLVDEYQDTNYAQQCIVLQLTQERQRVCAVGDDAQSIYAFRGANIDNILSFTSRYENARQFKLEQNYRSTQRIVQAANSLIKHNQRQIPKDVFSQNTEGDKLIFKQASSDKEESMIVCKDIERLKRLEQAEYDDFAILYRTNSQSRSFEEQLRKMAIPYRIYGGLSFYQRKEIKDIIAYFRLVVNPDDEEAFRRIVNYPTRGIGDTTVSKIIACAEKQRVSLWEVVSNTSYYGLEANKGTLGKINTFRALIYSFIERLPQADAYTLATEIIKDSGIASDIYSDKNPENIARQENLEEFLGAMQDFVETRREEDRGNEISLSDFLQEVSLLTDLNDDGKTDRERQGKVSLMTIHSAKGLEFQTVFIVGLEENIFPSPMASNSLRELEEERRLFYVAITRAKKHCILTCAKNRFRYGKLEFGTPSRFLRDIDQKLIKDDSIGDNRSFYQNSRPVGSQFRADPKPRIVAPRQPESSVSPFSERFKRTFAASGGNLRKLTATETSTQSQSPNAPMPEGTVIEHERFGIGTIIAVEGTGENTKATVEFRNAGTKQLLLKFARFKIIG